MVHGNSMHGAIWMWMSQLIFPLSGSHFMHGVGESLAARFVTVLPKPATPRKMFNMQLLCQTVRRNGFGLLRALWQVHCGGIDSYRGGKWIVITCLFLMTLGWVPSDLLQEIWIGLTPSSQQRRLSRLAGGRYKPSLHRSRAEPLRGYRSVKRGVRFVKLSRKMQAWWIYIYIFWGLAFSPFVFLLQQKKRAEEKEKI